MICRVYDLLSESKMTRLLLSNANRFLLSFPPSHSSVTSSSISFHHRNKQNVIKKKIQSAVANDSHISPVALGKRTLCISLITFSPLIFSANAAILEADDDVELLEKVKRDRKKRLEREGAINSATKETAYLQDLIYKLSRVGQAIDNNDLSSATSVLSQGTNTDWLKNVNSAFNKLSDSPEEKEEAETFNSSFALLISSVSKNDIESSKTAFVESANALEKWTTLTGLIAKLKGL